MTDIKQTPVSELLLSTRHCLCRLLRLLLFETKVKSSDQVGKLDQVNGVFLLVSDCHLDEEVDLFVAEGLVVVRLHGLEPRPRRLRPEVAHALSVQRLELLHDVSDPGRENTNTTVDNVSWLHETLTQWRHGSDGTGQTEEDHLRDFTRRIIYETSPEGSFTRLHPKDHLRDFTRRIIYETSPEGSFTRLHPKDHLRDFTRRIIYETSPEGSFTRLHPKDHLRDFTRRIIYETSPEGSFT